MHLPGANIRIQNIFKMTPEMSALFSAIVPSETPLSSQTGSEESSNGPLQSQHNNNNPNHLSYPNSDLFSIPPSRSLHNDGGLTGLFQKFNESSAGGVSAS